MKPLKDNFIKLNQLLEYVFRSQLIDSRIQGIFKKYIEYH